MEKQIEKAIRETLVISNPQSIHLAVKKILLLLDVSGELAVDECKCIRFTGGDKWYPNGCKIHPNG
jgi:hypothetical protein